MDDPSTRRASGIFHVTMTPQPLADPDRAGAIGRMSLDKRYEGDLVAPGAGEMLASRSAVAGSAGYVALERIDGVLSGRRGSFVLQHAGSMVRGTPSLSIVVVPDSGAGELVGLSGTLAITIADGEHRYDFDYTFATDA